MAEFSDQTHRMSLEGVREEYRLAVLDEQHCETNPIVQFERWMKEAQAADLKEPNAMTLSTVTPDGRPSGRVLLLKEVSEFGFAFYTSYTSRKALELEENPFAALTFYWPELERQVRVEGRASRVSREQSERYFRTRPRGSQLGAWASRQSEVIAGREQLELALKQAAARYRDESVPIPEFWGGYRLVPDSIEFWQGRPNRLHDRIRYRRKDESEWRVERLSP